MKQRISKKDMPAMAVSTWPRQSGIFGFNEFGDIVIAIIGFISGIIHSIIPGWWPASFLPSNQ